MSSRGWVCGVVVAGLAAMMVTPAAAEQARRGTEACAGCGITFEVAFGAEGSRLMAVGRDGTVVDKRVSREGLTIQVSGGGDALGIVADNRGTVTLARGARNVVVRPDSRLTDYTKAVRDLTAGSPIAGRLERMVDVLRSSSRPEALSVTASLALLRALQGDDSGNALLASRAPKRNDGRGIRPAQNQRGDQTTVGDCWEEYERTLTRNYERYGRCLLDYWWNQPLQYACGLEFAMVAELALFRVIACSGGLPI